MTSFEKAKKILGEKGAENFGILALDRPLSYTHYKTWLKKKQQAGMEYMKNFQPRKNPSEHFKPMKSIFVFQQTYWPKPENQKKTFFRSLKIARYARQKDYHLWFKDQLLKYAEALKEVFPEESFRVFTDSVPLLERDYAVQAGLAWVGKNTCVIHPKKGSFFFIGEILSSLEDSETSPCHRTVRDLCGSCTACITACPTGAIRSERVLDANLCLSYWNIESKKNPPPEIRKKMGSWFFGCDICQEVCPWNIKIHGDQIHFDHQTDRTDQTDLEEADMSSLRPFYGQTGQTGLEEELCFILKTSNKKLMKLLKDSPLSRAGGRGLKRNALIVIANLRLNNLKALVQTFLDDQRLGELAQWTLNQLKSTTPKQKNRRKKERELKSQ